MRTRALSLSAVVILVSACASGPVLGPVPLGLDLYTPVPSGNALTVDKVRLGRSLFHDTRLSADGSLACASCHVPEHAFSEPKPIAVGVGGREGTRNAPALINRAWGHSFFWDGRTTSLEEQVLRPIEDPNELGSSAEDAARRVGLSPEELSAALASYVRTIRAGDSPFDRFVDGDESALSDEARLGLRIFRNRAGCTRCHAGPLFTDELFHNTGVAWVSDEKRYQDDGRFLVTGREKDRGAFKTPTLREVARTAPYMHDGSLATLEAVVDFYDAGGRPNPNLDAGVRPLNLTPEEKRALIAFLESLSGTVQEGPAR